MLEQRTERIWVARFSAFLPQREASHGRHSAKLVNDPRFDACSRGASGVATAGTGNIEVDAALRLCVLQGLDQHAGHFRS